MNYWQELGREIRRRRTARGWSLARCAKHIGLVGLSADLLRVVETGEHRIDEWAAGYIALRFGADGATVDRWRALAGLVPSDIVEAVRAQPEKWADLRALLQCAEPAPTAQAPAAADAPAAPAKRAVSRAVPEIRAMVGQAMKAARSIIDEDEWYARPDGPPSFSDIYAWVVQQAGDVAHGLELPTDTEPRESCVEVVARALLVAERAQRGGAEEMAGRMEAAVTKSLQRYPGSQCMLLVLGEEVGELGRAVTGHVLRYPRGHKKHAGKREVLAECRDVAVVALRIALLGDDDFPTPTKADAAERAGS